MNQTMSRKRGANSSPEITEEAEREKDSRSSAKKSKQSPSGEMESKQGAQDNWPEYFCSVSVYSINS
jgi:hypothetical protein